MSHLQSGIRQILILVASNPFHATYQASNDCLPARNFPGYLLTLLLIFFLSFNSRVTSATLPDVIDQTVKPAEVHSLGIPTLYPFVSTMEPRRKDDKLHHDDLKQRTEDINVMGRPLREELL